MPNRRSELRAKTCKKLREGSRTEEKKSERKSRQPSRDSRLSLPPDNRSLFDNSTRRNHNAVNVHRSVITVVPHLRGLRSREKFGGETGPRIPRDYRRPDLRSGTTGSFGALSPSFLSVHHFHSLSLTLSLSSRSTDRNAVTVMQCTDNGKPERKSVNISR